MRVGVVTTALAALFAVAGCDGGEEPTDPPSSNDSTTADEPSTEPTTTPSATPPEVEAPTPAPEASVNDHVGAIWATRYFLDLYTYMRQSGDATQFEAMSSPACEFCRSVSDEAMEIHEGGGWVEGAALDFDIEEAAADYPTEDEPNYLVRFQMDEAPGVLRKGDGTSSPIEADSYAVVVALLYVDGRFIVSGVNAE